MKIISGIKFSGIITITNDSFRHENKVRIQRKMQILKSSY